MARIALCFPGQGSQAAGMAAGLIETDLGARLLETAAAHGLDLGSALAGDDGSLRPTEIAQPALLFTESVLASLLPAELTVVGAAGHSVGEYAAAVASGALDAREAMRLVIERGRLMAAQREGTMAAVLGLDADRCEAVCLEVTASGEGVVVVANLNAPGQVVISGSVAAVESAGARCREAGAKRVVGLNVSGAFHSPLMAPAAAAFGEILESAEIRDPRLPVVCNVDGTAVTTAAELRDRLRRQLGAPVQWIDCATRLAGLGADALVELGPGSVLAGLNRRIAAAVPTLSAATPVAVAELAGRLGELVHG